MRKFQRALEELDIALQAAWQRCEEQSAVRRRHARNNAGTSLSFAAVNEALHARKRRLAKLDQATQTEAPPAEPQRRWSGAQSPAKKMRRSSPTNPKHNATKAIQRHLSGVLARRFARWLCAYTLRDRKLGRNAFFALRRRVRVRLLLRVRARQECYSDSMRPERMIVDARDMAPVEGKNGVANMFRHKRFLCKAITAWVHSTTHEV